MKIALMIAALLAIPMAHRQPNNRLVKIQATQAAESQDAESKQNHKTVEIRFWAQISQDSAMALIKLLEQADDQADAVVLWINSPGGDLDATIKLGAVMEGMGKKLTCVVDGEAASGAFYMLQSCGHRIMTKRSVLMAHEVRFFTSGEDVYDRNKLENLMRLIDVYSNMYAEHCSARMSISVEEFSRRIKHTDWWMLPKEALRVGAVDEVVDSPNRALRASGACDSTLQSCPL